MLNTGYEKLSSKEKNELILDLLENKEELSQKNSELLLELKELQNSKQLRWIYYLNNPKLLIKKSFFRLFPHWLIPDSVKQKFKQILNINRIKKEDFLFRINKIVKEKVNYKGDIIIYSVIAWG